MAIQDDVNQQVFTLAQQTSGAVLSMTNDISRLFLDYLRQLIQKAKDEQALLYNTTGEVAIEKLQDAVKKGEELRNIFVPDEDIESFVKHLNKQEVLYAVSDIEKDNAKLISFLKRDEQKVMTAVEVLKAEHGLISELTPQMFLDGYGLEGFEMTTNLDKTQLELFRLYAKEKGIIFAAVNDEEHVNILYAPNQKDKVNAALLRLGWDLNGPYGHLIQEQVQHSLNARKGLSYVIDKGVDELYVVSSSNIKNYIKISPEGYSLFKNDNEIISEEIGADGFKDSLLERIEGLSNAVVLTKSEFEANLGERQKVVDSKLTLNTLPKDYNYEEESRRIERLKDLLNQKMGLNNELQDSFALFDTSISYSEYDTHEFESDRDIIEAREREMKRYNESVRYAQTNFRTVEVSGENKSIDYLIARAAKEREEIIKDETITREAVEQER